MIRIPIQVSWSTQVEYVDIRRNPFGDSNTVELMLPADCKNRVILPLTLFNRKEIHWEEVDAA